MKKICALFAIMLLMAGCGKPVVNMQNLEEPTASAEPALNVATPENSNSALQLPPSDIDRINTIIANYQFPDNYRSIFPSKSSGMVVQYGDKKVQVPIDSSVEDPADGVSYYMSKDVVALSHREEKSDNSLMVIVSPDEAETWNTVVLTLENMAQYTHFFFAFSGSENGYLLLYNSTDSNGVIYVTNDSGKSWEGWGSLSYDGVLYGMSAHDSCIFIYGQRNDEPYVLVSDDGKNYFDRSMRVDVVTGEKGNCASFIVDDELCIAHIWVYRDGGHRELFYVSSDNGVTWGLVEQSNEKGPYNHLNDISELRHNPLIQGDEIRLVSEKLLAKALYLCYLSQLTVFETKELVYNTASNDVIVDDGVRYYAVVALDYKTEQDIWDDIYTVFSKQTADTYFAQMIPNIYREYNGKLYCRNNDNQEMVKNWDIGSGKIEQIMDGKYILPANAIVMGELIPTTLEFVYENGSWVLNDTYFAEIH